MKLPKEFLHLTVFLKKLPGVGAKTAERYLFDLLKWNEEELKSFGSLLHQLKAVIKPCTTCGALTSENGCPFCNTHERDGRLLCIVTSPKDIFNIEKTATYKGHYHVLGKLLSPMKLNHIEHLPIQKIKERVHAQKVEEVILALDSTIDGDATSLYLKQELSPLGLKVSRLAFGIPVGSSLDYVDEGTLMRALAGRQLL